MVRIYALNIASLPDPAEKPEILAGLWNERREKALRAADPIKRKQSAGAALLLRELLKRQGLKLPRLMYTDRGKPYVPGICFNLSHSGDMVICAMGDRAVGCDAEKISKPRMKLAERFFAPAELEYLRACPEGERARTFFRLWTIKESYIKMCGEGLSLPLDSFCVSFDGDISLSRGGSPLPCRVKEYSVGEYCISLCSEEDYFSERLEFIPLSAL